MRRALGMVAIALLIGGCAASSDELIVSTAASLAGAFSEMEESFEAQNPGVDVILNIGGSTTLGYQIVEGAPIDVFASADEQSLAEVVVLGLNSADATFFASNRLQIVVPQGNPGDVSGLESLADKTLLVGACAETLPCGRLAADVLADSGIVVEFDTLEPNVRALLDKVVVGELDAGLVYLTDTAADVEPIEIESDRANHYPIVTISDRHLATEFVDFVISVAGQEILASHGFGAP